MSKIRKSLWLTIAILSILVCLYVSIDEGFMNGKAYMFIVSFALGIWGYGIKEIFSKIRKKST